jgi:hypothetical protein
MSYNNYSDKIIKQSLQLYIDGQTCNHISHILKVPVSTIWRWVSAKGLIRSPEEHWTDAEVELLIKVWPIQNKSDIKYMFANRTWQSLVFKASQLGVRRDVYFDSIKKCILDFSIIDSQEKAYLLGFIAADGSVSKPTSKGAQKLKIALAEQDLDHLCRMRDLLCPRAVIKIFSRKKDTHQNLCELHINDTEFCRLLKRYGIVPNKAKILGPPLNIPNKLLTHFIRGLFDGDGSVYFNKSNKTYCCIDGNYDILYWINEKFRKHYNHGCKVYKGHACDRISYGYRTAEAFLEWIYTDATLYLPRKFERVYKRIEDRGLRKEYGRSKRKACGSKYYAL